MGDGIKQPPALGEGIGSGREGGGVSIVVDWAPLSDQGNNRPPTDMVVGKVMDLR